jgi:hypothetical protein
MESNHRSVNKKFGLYTFSTFLLSLLMAYSYSLMSQYIGTTIQILIALICTNVYTICSTIYIWLQTTKRVNSKEALLPLLDTCSSASRIHCSSLFYTHGSFVSRTHCSPSSRHMVPPLLGHTVLPLLDTLFLRF